MRRHSNRLSQHLLKGGHNTAVQGCSPLVEDVSSDFAMLYDTIQIILNNRITEPGHQVILCTPLLLIVYQV